MSVWKVQTAVAYSSATSSGEVTYYESEEALLADLLDAHLAMAAERERRGLRYRMLRAWRRRSDQYPKVTRIIGIFERRGDEWVEIDVEFVEPIVRLVERAS